MRMPALMCILLALLPAGASSNPLRVARPPELVGPPRAPWGACPLKITTPGGTTSGADIPLPALRLGAVVERNENSFPTGGGGTANATERHRRMLAGLQYDPRTFDPAAKALPSVFAVERSQVVTPWIYQHLPIGSDGKYGRGMVFAQATSATRGRIASLSLVLPTRPIAAPRLAIIGGQPLPGGCRPENPIDVYAPGVPAAQLRRLFGASGCTWNTMAACSRAEWPRGRVLFVQKQQDGSGYEYRWVDYDLLAASLPMKPERS